jgi:hypothetical protein
MKSLLFLNATMFTGKAVAAHVPKVLSHVRGANYRAAGAKDTTDHWLHYNPAETERDLNYARPLNLSQIHVFVSYVCMDRGPSPSSAAWASSRWWETRSRRSWTMRPGR